MAVTNNKAINDTDGSAGDLVIEGCVKMKTTELLNQYIAQGVKCVVVTPQIKKRYFECGNGGER